jgi:hypothetical protein
VSLDAIASRGRYDLQPANQKPSTKPLVVGLDRVLNDLYGRGTPIP